MKKKFLAGLTAGVFAMGLSCLAHADLTVIGSATYSVTGQSYRLIHDSDKQLTWLDYTKGLNIQQSQIGWATDLKNRLTINLNSGVSLTNPNGTWRLPRTEPYPSSNINYNLPTTEFGHLHFVELGNAGGYLVAGTTPGRLRNTGPFQNLEETGFGAGYWTATLSGGGPYAWYFNFWNGLQTTTNGGKSKLAIAVLPGGVTCNDGNLCTTDRYVAGTGCTFTPISCSDGDACTANTCIPTTGCSYNPVNCDDGSACTDDTCDSSTGCASTPVNCDDGNACTDETCDPVTGCSYNPVNCDDGNACTDETCDPVKGCASIPVNCDDGNACTDETCDPVTGCASTPVSCDDGNDCTDDSCDAVLGCLNTPVPVDTPCPDASFCKGVGTCDETGTCVGQSVDCPILSSCVGFDPPLDQSPVKVNKHRALPLKANLFDGDGFEITDVEITSPPVIQVLFSLDNTTPPIDVTEFALSPGMSTGGNQFEYTGSKWQFNLSTKNYTASGKYDITIQSGDLTEYEVEACGVSFVVE